MPAAVTDETDAVVCNQYRTICMNVSTQSPFVYYRPTEITR